MWNMFTMHKEIEDLINKVHNLTNQVNTLKQEIYCINENLKVSGFLESRLELAKEMAERQYSRKIDNLLNSFIHNEYLIEEIEKKLDLNKTYEIKDHPTSIDKTEKENIFLKTINELIMNRLKEYLKTEEFIQETINHINSLQLKK